MDWLKKIVPGTAPDGAHILSVLGKQTYKISNGAKAIADEIEQLPFYETDEYYGCGNPLTGAIKHESDLVAYKPMTDVLFTGSAHCPRGKKAYYLDVSIQVAARKKTIRVFGNRRVYMAGNSVAFTDAEPFTEMSLDYSLAYGGADKQSEEGAEYIYPRNPAGKGFIVKKNPVALQNLPLPNLEDPSKLLTPGNLVMEKFQNWDKYPLPMALSATGRNFHPRYTFAGLPPDAHMENEMARQQQMYQMPEIGAGPDAVPPSPSPILNLQYYNSASPDMQFPYLKGDESVSLIYMDQDFPQFNFQLPGIRPTAWLDVGEGPEDMQMVPHTVEILKPANQVTLVWRGFVYYGGPEAMTEFEKFDFGVEAKQS